MELDFDKIARYDVGTVPDGFFAAQRAVVMARIRRRRRLVLLERSLAAAAVTVLGIMCFHQAVSVNPMTPDQQIDLLVSEYTDSQLSDAVELSEAEYLFDPDMVGYNY